MLSREKLDTGGTLMRYNAHINTAANVTPLHDVAKRIRILIWRYSLSLTHAFVLIHYDREMKIILC